MVEADEEVDDVDDVDEDEEEDDGDDELLFDCCCRMDTVVELTAQNCCSAFLTLSNRMGSFDCKSFCRTR